MNAQTPHDLDTDPHVTAAWFELLADTAMPAGARFESINVTTPGVAACTLPMVRLPESPHELRALANYYTPVYSSVGNIVPDCAGLTQALSDLRRRSGAPAMLDFFPMATDSALFGQLVASLKSAGWWADPYFRFGNWFTPVTPGDFQGYLAERPSRLRNTLSRSERKLDRLGDVEIDIVTHPGHPLETAIEQFVEVYLQSWKRPEPWPRFIPELCRLASNKGWLRLGIVRHAGKPIAAQLWLIAGQRAQIVKLAQVEGWPHGSVGTVLTARMAQHAIDVDRVRELDYLIGDDAYKRDWTPMRRERHGIVAFNPARLRGAALGARHFGGRIARALTQRGRE